MIEAWWFVLGFLSGVVAGVFGLFALGRSVRRLPEKQVEDEVQPAKSILDDTPKKKNRTMWD